MTVEWEKCRLGSIVERLTNGYVGPTRDIYLDTGVPYLLARHVKNSSLNFDGKTFVSEGFNQKNRKSILKAEDVLLVQSGHIGHSAVVPGSHEGHNCHAMIVISPIKARLSGDFLSFYFNSREMRERFAEIRTGSTVPHLNGRDVKELQIPLPTLPEQKRIVTILDEAFAGIATATANAEKNLQNARELFESHLQSAFTKKGEGWVEKPINKFAKVLNGFSFKSGDFSQTNEVKSIKIANVGVKAFVQESSSYLPKKFSTQYGNYRVDKGNIVIALTRSIISTGLKVAIVPDDYDGALLNQRVAAINSDESIILQQFLYSFLSTKQVVNFVKKQANTLMQPNLSIKDLKNLLVPCPPKNIQKDIVAKIEALSAETKRLEAIYQKKLDDLAELKQSILQKAFAGELSIEN